MEYIYTQSAAEDVYLYHLFLYYEKADPMLSDYDFDQLELKFKKQFPESKIFQFGTLAAYKDKLEHFENRYKKHKNSEEK